MCYWVIPLKGIMVKRYYAFSFKRSNRKLNKIWVDKGSKFFNRSMKSWLEKNNIDIYSSQFEGKSVVTERFIRTLKNNIYKYMTSISKNLHIDKLDGIVNKDIP